VLTITGAGSEPAPRFHERLRSPRAKEVFEKYGFTWLAGQ
jgi:hypothetical protein